MGGDINQRRDYDNSLVELPSIWTWKTLSGMAPSYAIRAKQTKSFRAERMDSSKYFPFCEKLYLFAVGSSPCNWLHFIGEDNKSNNNTYNFPCGCTNPKIQYCSLDQVSIKSSSGFMKDPESTQIVEVPRCPVFAQGVAVKKRKRKRSQLSLTDNKYYSRKVRERNQKAAKAAKGCSKQMLNEDESTDCE